LAPPQSSERCCCFYAQDFEIAGGPRSSHQKFKPGATSLHCSIARPALSSRGLVPMTVPTPQGCGRYLRNQAVVSAMT
jgi:hypothetical protein